MVGVLSVSFVANSANLASDKDSEIKPWKVKIYEPLMSRQLTLQLQHSLLIRHVETRTNLRRLSSISISSLLYCGIGLLGLGAPVNTGSGFIYFTYRRES